MLITLNHKTTGLQATISTDSFDPDEPVKPRIASDSSDLDYILQSELGTSTGVYGHLMDIESTTNLDLYAATKKLKHFHFVSIDQEIEPSDLPENVNT
jgi:hypothetical protein